MLDENSEMNETPRRVRRRRGEKPVIDRSVPSPCVGLCTLNSKTELCDGCYRSMDEIREWIIMPREEKLEALELIKARKVTLGI